MSQNIDYKAILKAYPDVNVNEYLSQVGTNI